MYEEIKIAMISRDSGHMSAYEIEKSRGIPALFISIIYQFRVPTDLPEKHQDV